MARYIVVFHSMQLTQTLHGNHLIDFYATFEDMKPNDLYIVFTLFFSIAKATKL